MTVKKNKTEAKVDADNPSILDRLNSMVDTPAKLFGFCAALLLISLTTGMLVGSAVKNDPASDQTAALHPQRPDLTLRGSNPAAADEQNLYDDDGTDEKPVDAFTHDNPYSIPRTNGDADIPSFDGEDVIANLPPTTELPQTDAALPAWKRYAALSEPADGRPKIAIVIDDVGINKSRVRALVDLPQMLTLSFLPYATDLASSAELTRTKGHEVMLHLPMEPLRESADPGPDALLKKLTLDEIRATTLKNLAQFSGYVGVNNHMGSKFTAYEEGMAVVMDVLQENGLLFLDSRTTPTSKGYKLAQERGMPSAVRDVFIDNEINKEAILKQLKQVERIARKNGIAIAIGHPHKETIAALKQWMPEAVESGFYFIPMSAGLSDNNG